MVKNPDLGHSFAGYRVSGIETWLSAFILMTVWMGLYPDSL